MYEATRKAIEARFNTEWAGATSVRYENVPFTPPASMEWVSLVIKFGKAYAASVNPPVQERCPGLVMISVFTPKDNGSKRTFDLADSAAAVYRNQILTESTTTVRLRTPYPNAPIERADYHQVNVIIPFLAQRNFS